MTTSPITHLIYDMDGLLLDTEGFYTEVTQKIVASYGQTFDWSLKSKMMGRQAIESATLLVNELKLPITPEEYLAQRNVDLDALFPKAQAMPGAVALTQHMHKHHITQAIATSSTQNSFALKSTLHQDWFSLFTLIVTGGSDQEVEHGKPAPDIFRVTAKRLGVLPQNCIVFEDAPAGIEAAKSAGMLAIAVPDPQTDHSLYSHADVILSSLWEFEPQSFGLPHWENVPT